MTGNTSSNANVSSEGPTTVSRLTTLGIGVFAGICACVFPRLIVLINSTNQDMSGLELFALNYLLCTAMISVIVGGVVMIFQWHAILEPGKTFMMALSVPALIAGGLNTNNAFDLYTSNAETLAMVTNALGDSLQINTESTPVKIHKIGSDSPDNTSFLLLLGGRAAHAMEPGSKSSSFLGFKEKEPSFMILLDTSDSKEGILEKAKELKERYKFQGDELIEIGANRFGIAYQGWKVTLPEAVLKIYELKKNYPDLRPSLLPVPD